MRCNLLLQLSFLGLLALLSGCHAQTQHATNAAGESSSSDRSQLGRFQGSFDELPSAVFFDDPIRGAEAQERVAWAIELAKDATLVSYDVGDGLEFVERLAPNVSALRAAMLHVDEGISLGLVAATPLPYGRPVTVQQRRESEKRSVKPGRLKLYVGRSERYDIHLFEDDGRMRLAGIVEASRALRDQGSQISKSIDPRLLAMLYLVGQYFDSEIQVVSGYRVRGVNASRGSRHGYGQAIDFRIAGVSIQRIAVFVETTFANIGVGIYPTSGFVHLDTRDKTFYWRDSSGPGQRNRTRARNIVRRGDPKRDPTLRSMHLTEEEIFGWPRAE